MVFYSASSLETLAMFVIVDEYKLIKLIFDVIWYIILTLFLNKIKRVLKFFLASNISNWSRYRKVEINFPFNLHCLRAV